MAECTQCCASSCPSERFFRVVVGGRRLSTTTACHPHLSTKLRELSSPNIPRFSVVVAHTPSLHKRHDGRNDSNRNKCGKKAQSGRQQQTNRQFRCSLFDLRALIPIQLFDLAPAGRVRELPLPLVLEMLSVAIRQGSSIPRALIAVGDIAAGEFGAGLRSAGEQLNKGVSWDDAWPDDGDLAVVRDAFASSWHSGASPVERLETAVEQLDWDERSQIEQAAAKLSVRLLLPTVVPRRILPQRYRPRQSARVEWRIPAVWRR